MMTFLEWNSITDSINAALDQNIKQSDQEPYTNFYTIQTPIRDNWKETKRIIEKTIPKFIHDDRFAFYPSDYALKYDGMKNNNFNLNFTVFPKGNIIVTQAGFHQKAFMLQEK